MFRVTQSSSPHSPSPSPPLAGATGTASAATSFGADLDPNGPAALNSSSPHALQRVRGARSAPGFSTTPTRPAAHEKAPKSGTLKQVSLIAGAPGSFKLQLVKVKRRERFGQGGHERPEDQLPGPGRSETPRPTTVETFKTDSPGPPGRAAGRSPRSGPARCAAAPEADQHAPLQPGAEGRQRRCRHSSPTNGCWLLIEGVIK